MSTYRIFQADLDDDNFDERRWVFFGWDTALERGFNQEAYNLIYEGEIEDSSNDYYTLERLFDIFNAHIPPDFEGRSLSISDVVELDGQAYYVDRHFEPLDEDVWNPDFDWD